MISTSATKRSVRRLSPRSTVPKFMKPTDCSVSSMLCPLRTERGYPPRSAPEFATADVEGTQRRNRGRAVLHPAHARPLQPFADDFAARLRGTTADVPALLPVGRIIDAMAVVLEVAD